MGNIGYKRSPIGAIWLLSATSSRYTGDCEHRPGSSRAAKFSDEDVVRWERIYGAGAAAFGTALGLLSFRALELGDAPGAWLSFGCHGSAALLIAEPGAPFGEGATNCA